MHRNRFLGYVSSWTSPVGNIRKTKHKHGFYILRCNSCGTSAITFYSSTSLLNDLSLSACTDNYGFPLIAWFTTIVQLSAMSRKIYARDGHIWHTRTFYIWWSSRCEWYLGISVYFCVNGKHKTSIYKSSIFYAMIFFSLFHFFQNFSVGFLYHDTLKRQN